MVSWKRTFYAAWFTQLIAFTGFSFVLPFTALYIKELGVTEEQANATWAGYAIGATALTLMIASPIWGVLADRYGRRMMLLRAMFGGVVVLAAMGLCQNARQLLICRLAQGLFTGTIGACVALVASISPRERLGYTLGMMQGAVFAGSCVGPFLGGRLADAFGKLYGPLMGFRVCFFAASFLTLIAAILAVVYVHEEFAPAPRSERSGNPARDLWRTFAAPGFLALGLVFFVVRMGGAVTGPVFPLYLMYGLSVAAESVAKVTGDINGAAGVAAAVASGIFGKFSDRWGHRRLLIGCALAGGLFGAAQAFAPNVGILFVCNIMIAFAIAGVVPAINALSRETAGDHNVGKVFGVIMSVGALGMMVGPMVGSWAYNRIDRAAPFIVLGALLWLAALAAWAGLSRRPPAAGS